MQCGDAGDEGAHVGQQQIGADEHHAAVEYALTALGKTLREPLAAICAWATEHSAPA